MFFCIWIYMIKAEFFGNISVAYCNFLFWKVLLCLLIIFKMPESAFSPPLKIFPRCNILFCPLASNFLSSVLWLFNGCWFHRGRILCRAICDIVLTGNGEGWLPMDQIRGVRAHLTLFQAATTAERATLGTHHHPISAAWDPPFDQPA